MGLGYMIVTDSNGSNSDKGAYAYYYDSETGKRDPYRFYAMTRLNAGAETTSPNVVQIALSLGGALSGFCRFPRIGERVLVYGSGVDYYLMGYIPSADDDFFDASEAELVDDEVFDGEGLFIRHKNTASAFADTAKKYSEISFYREGMAEWPATAGGADYPSIDTIGIDSAGDLKEYAANHLLQRGKRIEILADAPEMDHRTCKVDNAGTLPLGDYPGDDSYLHEGDIHIRAGNRVVIKAATEIRLQVGRTLLRIGDDGFNVITRNVCGNYINSYDASLSMTPRDGISLTGKNVNLQAGYRLNMGDGLGGAMSAAMGNLSISGREISLDSSNALEYKFMAAYQGLEYLVNAASGGMALSGEADVRIAEYIKFTIDNLKSLGQLGRRLNSVWMKRKEVGIDLDYIEFLFDERDRISRRGRGSRGKPLRPVLRINKVEHGFLSEAEFIEEWRANIMEYARTLIRLGKLPSNWNPFWDKVPEENFRWDRLPSGRKFLWPEIPRDYEFND